MNGKWESKVKGAWTAIAHAPWLKAISLFAKGDCWHGGGLFTGDRSYWLNDGAGHELLETTSQLIKVPEYEGLQNWGGECVTIYYNRLQRDGWELKDHERVNDLHDKAFFEKPLSRGWRIRKICHEQVNAPKGKGVYWEEHILISKLGKETEFSDWEWAEKVGNDIAYAKEGRFYRVSIKTPGELSPALEIHDFNPYEFERIAAPY